MLRFAPLIDTVSDRIGKVFSFGLCFMTGFIAYEVVMRYAFNNPTRWVHETSGYLFAICFMFGGSYALRHGAHVRVDILFARLSPRGRAIADIIFTPLMFLIVGTLVWAGVEGALDSVGILEKSQTAWEPPLYPVKILVAVAIVMFALQVLAKLTHDIYTAVSGRKIDEH